MMKTITIILVGIIAGAFLYDLTRTARARGKTRKDIIIWLVIYLFVFVILLIVNVALNRHWTPGKFIFRLGF